MLLLSVVPAAAQGEPARLSVGDVLQVVLPGEDGFNKPFKIDRDGRIELPEVGAVQIDGLTLAEAKEKIRAALAVSFRDLSRFNLVLKERRLLLTVLGYVKQPGPVDLPAGANIQMAINAAGGLSQGAQLDHMQVRRGGDVITFDYKKYLDSGDSRVLPVLRPLDEVFVPSSPLSGNVHIDFDPRTLAAAGDAAEDRSAVRVFGEVNSPGSFAFRPGVTAVDALLRAGGVTRYAGVEQIRIISGNSPRIFNLKAYLDSGNQALNQPLTAGTTIFVPKEAEEVRSGPHVVYVMGEVAKPGAYEVRAGTSFLDILANAGGPTRFADSRQIRVLRAGGGVESFDLSAYSEGGGHIALPRVQAGDAVFVPEKTQANEQASWLRTPPSRAVRVIGAVKAPGRYEWSDEMSLLDLVAQAGGPNERGDLNNVTILTGDSGGRAIKFNLQHFLDHGGSVGSLPVIHGGYTVTVAELPQSPSDTRSTWLKQPADTAIYVMGSVGHPGRYAFADGLSFLDIISAADGPTSAADILNIRVDHRGEGRDRVTKVNLAAYFETGDDSLLPHVRPGDVIFVPDRNRNWLEESPANTIRVLGSVGKPGRYRFTDGMTILDLLAEAGGPTSSAYQEKIVVVNLSCCGNQARLFNLVAFAKKGDFSTLPALRAGDTVYVPSIEQSDWKIFMDNVHDSISVLSILALFKVLL
jgi:protein involved in polysaccharide export with SLBB domain